MHLTGCASRWGMQAILQLTGWDFASTTEQGYASLAAHDGLQAAGASPLITGQPVANPDTVATAIRIGLLTERAIAVQSASLGEFNAVTDAEITTPIDFGIRRRHFVNLPVPHRWRGC